MSQPSTDCPLTAQQYYDFLVWITQKLSRETDEVPNAAVLICRVKCPDKSDLFAGYLHLREEMNQTHFALDALELLCNITGDKELDSCRFEFEVMVAAVERAMDDFKSRFIVQGEVVDGDVSDRLHRLEAQMIRLNKLPGIVKAALSDELAKQFQRDLQAKLKLLNEKEEIIY